MLCQCAKDAGSEVGDLETADGQKLKTTNGIKLREVSASRALSELR
jgi:hypothetical protein